MTASPVPDLGTLRSICQGEKVRRDRRPWYVLSRRVSLGVTWVLLHTPVSANQVTFVSLLLTIAAGVLLAAPAANVALAGALALVLHYFLDKVDGEIARFRGVFSLKGLYLDELSHTFAYAGPMFRRPISIETGITVERDGYVFTDLCLTRSESSV